MRPLVLLLACLLCGCTDEISPGLTAPSDVVASTDAAPPDADDSATTMEPAAPDVSIVPDLPDLPDTAPDAATDGKDPEDSTVVDAPDAGEAPDTGPIEPSSLLFDPALIQDATTLFRTRSSTACSSPSRSAQDSRITAGVALSGTGGWGTAVQSPDAWQHALLTEAGLTTESAEWINLLAWIDSTQLLFNPAGLLCYLRGRVGGDNPSPGQAARQWRNDDVVWAPLRQQPQRRNPTSAAHRHDHSDRSGDSGLSRGGSGRRQAVCRIGPCLVDQRQRLPVGIRAAQEPGPGDLRGSRRRTRPISSRPSIPEGLVPHIRATDSCL